MTDTTTSADTVKPTRETYERFQQFYDYLNRCLFQGELPGCLLTLQRKRRTYGFFSGNRFSREDGRHTDEIALNPAHFRDRPLADILATLAHEMVHQWQHHYGKSGRGPYHNKQWAEKMKTIGLQPTDSGEPEGKETGDRVLHLIMPDGAFAKAAERLSAKGLAISWLEMPEPPRPARPKENEDGKEVTRSGERLKYVCSDNGCSESVRGRAGIRLLCQGNEHTGPVHEPSAMVPEALPDTPPSSDPITR